jgi:hypothetical protein
MAGAVKGACHKCGKKLRGRQRRWCSTTCSRWFLQNHRWTDARRECRRKAKVKGVRAWRCSALKGCVTDRPEVNHKTPCLGRHGSIGCHHHQEGIECVCRKHHLEITARQRAEGLFKK